MPIHNRFSEPELHREALGRKNRLFVGQRRGREVNSTVVTLLAGRAFHGLEPWACLRDLLSLVLSWPKKCVLDLAPAYRKQTVGQQAAPERLAANVFGPVFLGELNEHRPAT